MKLKLTIAVLVFAAVISAGCSGGSLLNPQPLVGKDRLVIQITDLRDLYPYICPEYIFRWRIIQVQGRIRQDAGRTTFR